MRANARIDTRSFYVLVFFLLFLSLFLRQVDPLGSLLTLEEMNFHENFRTRVQFIAERNISYLDGFPLFFFFVKNMQHFLENAYIAYAHGNDKSMSNSHT